MSKVRGVSPDLVVRPMGWKGNISTVRTFSTAVSTFGMGMMGEEFVWRLGEKAGPDPDGDGVTREMSVGDITAMTIYNAAQAVPTELGRLAELGLVEAPDAAAKARIEKGRALFTQVGCASCHMPEMHLTKTVFEEPTLGGGGNYIDRFLASKDPDYDPKRPARFDLLKDSLEPRIEATQTAARPCGSMAISSGTTWDGSWRTPGVRSARFFARAGAVRRKIRSDSTVRVPDAELWGVGTTGPCLHDDRAGTLAEAIMLHGEDTPPALASPDAAKPRSARRLQEVVARGSDGGRGLLEEPRRFLEGAEAVVTTSTRSGCQLLRLETASFRRGAAAPAGE